MCSLNLSVELSKRDGVTAARLRSEEDRLRAYVAYSTLHLVVPLSPGREGTSREDAQSSRKAPLPRRRRAEGSRGFLPAFLPPAPHNFPRMIRPTSIRLSLDRSKTIGFIGLGKSSSQLERSFPGEARSNGTANASCVQAPWAVACRPTSSPRPLPA